ncbi:MAG: ATP-dependent Clp protease adaptor ClpS [Desulfuromonadales bacterium GWD2_61_12]|nr:MAG: ATP-dependent Clp protease adaptor ClpS [Desulfuromonadales bacterium GWC2_61_20]OGR32972.1 MAG: ATP-dependent Clp protease adaptor ClpS [Desulfuromonadales bacterium GWD2_61_12]
MGAASETRTGTNSQVKPGEPGRFRVLMHNDDYTTMEFVVQVLQKVFHKTTTEANQIMLSIHFRGVGVCGLYPYDIAETKVDRVHVLAREAGFPLRCSLEGE